VAGGIPEKERAEGGEREMRKGKRARAAGVSEDVFMPSPTWHWDHNWSKEQIG